MSNSRGPDCDPVHPVPPVPSDGADGLVTPSTDRVATPVQLPRPGHTTYGSGRDGTGAEGPPSAGGRSLGVRALPAGGLPAPVPSPLDPDASRVKGDQLDFDAAFAACATSTSTAAPTLQPTATSTGGLPTLRPYQHDALAAVRARFEAGERSTLVLMPTGTGKTRMFADLVRQGTAAGRRALVLAHRSELLTQAATALAAAGVWVAIEQAERRAGRAHAVVASVQTLRGRRLASWPRDSFDLVVIDEGHHAIAKTHRDILEHFAEARVLGVTATADRADGEGLGTVFESVAYRYELGTAIRDGCSRPSARGASRSTLTWTRWRPSTGT